MKVYAVYSIPNSPEYRLEKLFKTKEGAKQYIKDQKSIEFPPNIVMRLDRKNEIFDIQIEDIQE